MFNVSFLGKREDKNAVEQLKKKGDALTLNNQRNINTAIDNLSKDSSEENIQFLMNVAKGLRYGTSFQLDDKKSNNDWRGKLQQATAKALENTDSPNKAKLQEQFKATFLDKKEMTKDEKAVLDLRNKLMQTKGLPQAMNDSKNDAVRNISKNLDYFVISTEVTTEEKKACLEKLNKMMSPDYKITDQLKDKKPQVLGEILNDLVVKTAESDKPTIKTTDQRHHGMCAAISTSRKLMAYEYKDKYVTMIMEELSNKPTMEVYDPTKLGTNKKIPVEKTPVDFDYADDKGYRILDASALQWMNIAGKTGDGSKQATDFSAFDKEYFDTFHDAFYMRDLDDPKLVPHQHELRALNKAKESIGTAKKSIAKRQKAANEQRQNERFNAQTVVRANKALTSELKALMPEKNDEEMNKVLNNFLKMGKVKGKQSDEMHFFDYEEKSMKKQKMGNFIKAENPNVKQEDIDARIDNIFNMYELSTETTEEMNREYVPKSPESKMKKHYKPLYEAAAMYRTAQDKKLDVPETLAKEVKRYGLGKDATKADVMKKYEQEGKVVSEPILRSMQDKYNKIAKYAAVVEKAEVKGDKVDMPDLYVMSKDEKAALDNVGKNLNKMYAEVSRDTKAKEQFLEKPLNDLAKEVGREVGSFWVSEGSSGLFSQQSIRILEQMTGKPYYKEENIDTIVDTIKKGKHSGTSSTSVYHNDNGWHAQYIADVAPVMVKDPKTGKIEVKDAIMHDNTWGACEHEKTWLDSRGLLRTDYRCGRGGKDGYITNSAWQNGTLVEEFKYEPGVIGGKPFKMFTGAELQTDYNDTTSTAQTLVQNAFVGPQVKMSSIANVLNSLDKVSAKDLEKTMVRAERAGETFSSNKAKVLGDLNKIHSEADISKASEKTQSYLTQIAENMSVTKESAMDSINNALASSKYVNKYTIDDIKDDDFKVLRNFIDTKFDPSSNEQFVEKLKELAKMPEEQFEELLNNSTDAELGVKTVSPFEVVRQIKGLEPSANTALSNLIWTDSLEDNIKLTKNGDSFEEAFFVLQRDWDNLNTTKQIKAMRKSALEQSGVRSAYPDCQLTTPEETSNLAKGFAGTLKDAVEVVNTLKKMENDEIPLPQGLTKGQVALAKKNQLKDISEGRKIFIEANIEPQHRQVVTNKLNTYLSNAIKGNNVESSYKDFENSFNKYHVMNNPKELLKEFVRLSKANDPAKKQLQQVYENYMIQGSIELAKFDTAVAMLSEASEGHMQEVGKDLAKITTPKEWDPVTHKSHNLGTDEGFKEFLESSQNTNGVDNTLTMINHLGQNDRAMRLEMTNLPAFDALKQTVNAQNLEQVVDFITMKNDYVSGLNLKNCPEEQKMQEQYLAKIDEMVDFINENAERILSQAQQ